MSVNMLPSVSSGRNRRAFASSVCLAISLNSMAARVEKPTASHPRSSPPAPENRLIAVGLRTGGGRRRGATEFTVETLVVCSDRIGSVWEFIYGSDLRIERMFLGRPDGPLSACSDVRRGAGTDHRRDGSRRLRLHPGEHMGVLLQREGGRLVPEPFAHDLDGHPGLERERCVGMPQVV